ncbi:hypothetical protein [Noviherbaspirillum cavernae]|uniref:hypothetical protein n=1 Tax=Noviherbaspirillum cavernae TaxID=2320862 RepID=UPI0011C49A07|nr:hypothetical protein [Noviherbaspirillum cavernae]
MAVEYQRMHANVCSNSDHHSKHQRAIQLSGNTLLAGMLMPKRFLIVNVFNEQGKNFIQGQYPYLKFKKEKRVLLLLLSVLLSFRHPASTCVTA